LRRSDASSGPTYRDRVYFNEDNVLNTIDQITDLYTREELLGRQVVGVVNFPPRQIGPVRSECLVTGFHREDGAVVLARPDSEVPNGARLA